MSLSIRICAKVLVFSQIALIGSCGEKQGQEPGKDPRVPVSLKIPNSEPNSAPGQPSGPNLNQGNEAEDTTDHSEPKNTTLPPSPGASPSDSTPVTPNDPSNPSGPSSGPSPTVPSSPTDPTNPSTPVDPTSPSTPPVTPIPGQPLPPQPPQRSTLTIKINGLHNEKGNVCLSLFNSPDGFPDSDSKAVLAECFEVIARSFEIKIENVPPGTYAIALWHDENRDKKLNYNFLGIPKEGLAFSERGKPRITPPPGPPSFNAIAFEIKNGEPRTTETQMTYLLDLL